MCNKILGGGVLREYQYAAISSRNISGFRAWFK